MKLQKLSAKAVLLSLAVSLSAVSSLAGDIKGKVSVQGLKSAANIAVYVDTIPDKKFDPPSQHVVVDQKKMEFIPRVAVVVQGTTVDFTNSDPVGHNVYWPSISGNKKLTHNLGTWPKGDKKSFQFNDPRHGIPALQCPPGDVRLCRRGQHSLLRRYGQGRQL